MKVTQNLVDNMFSLPRRLRRRITDIQRANTPNPTIQEAAEAKRLRRQERNIKHVDTGVILQSSKGPYRRKQIKHLPYGGTQS